MFLVPLTQVTQASRPSQQFVRSLDRLFDDRFDRFFADTPRAAAPRVPTLDVTEVAGSYTARLDLPGVAKEDVRVSIEGRKVTVQAQAQAKPELAKTEPEPATAEAETRTEAKDESRVLLRERQAAHFARSFTLPAEVEQAETQAKLENGVLTLTLPKRVQRNPSQITIN